MKLHYPIVLVFLLFFALIGFSQQQKKIMARTIQYVQSSNEYIIAHQWDSARIAINNISEIAQNYPTPFNNGILALQKGIYSKRTKSYDESVTLLNSAYDYFQVSNNDTLMGISLNHLGEVYRILELNELSLKSYRHSLRLMKKTKNYRQQSFTLSNLANYFKKNQLLDSAKYYYDKSLELKNKHSISGKGKTLNNLAGVYYLMNDLDVSRNLYLRAVREAKKENDSSFISYPMIELALIDITNTQFESAKKTLNDVSKLELDPKSELRYYDIMTYYFEEIGDFKEALDWRNKYIAFYRGYINEVQTKNIQDLSVFYETERKDLEIESQKLKIDVQNQSISLKNGQLIFLGAGILSILILTYVTILGIRRRNKIENLLSRFEGEKSIKTSIGKNLHDFVAPELHAARMKLELLQLKQSSPEIGSIVQQLQESTENIRGMSHQLSPMIYRLEVTTFRAIIKNAMVEFERYANIDVRMNIQFPESLDALPEEDQENIYGIILEGLNNVRRHSKAKTLSFSISETKKGFILCLMDDGVGISETKKAGIGIQNMKNRADLLGGTISFETLEKGSELKLIFPKK